jgi:hypothetical protein
VIVDELGTDETLGRADDSGRKPSRTCSNDDHVELVNLVERRTVGEQ